MGDSLICWSACTDPWTSEGADQAPPSPESLQRTSTRVRSERRSHPPSCMRSTRRRAGPPATERSRRRIPPCTWPPEPKDAIVRVVPQVFDHTRENTPAGVVQASASLPPHPRSDGVPPFAAPSEPTTDIGVVPLLAAVGGDARLDRTGAVRDPRDPHGVAGGADAHGPTQPLVIGRERRCLADHAPDERPAAVAAASDADLAGVGVDPRDVDRVRRRPRSTVNRPGPSSW